MAKSIKGRNGDDNLTGTDRGDRIDGKGGNDTIFGLGGNDDIKGGKGNDIIDGGAGNDEIDGGQGDDHLSGGAGNDEIVGDSGNDILFGGDGDDAMHGDRSNGSGGGSGSGSGAPVTFNDYLDGGAGNDLMVGGQGDDTLLGGTGNDILWGDSIERSGSGGRGSGSGGRGAGSDGAKGKKGSGGGSGSGSGASGSGDAGTFNDYLDGGAGDDQIHAGIGDDVAGYTAAENVGATDIYAGGDGIDTLSLYLTGDEYAAAAAEIAAYQAFIAANTNAVTGEANSNEFQFSTFDLTASEFEDVNVHAAINDAVEIGEDDGATVFASVLDNDLGSQDVTGVSVVAGTEPSEGVLVFNADGSYSFDPAGAFEHLAVGETATVSFDYLVSYANGGSNTATVTITITGANDAPIITAADAAGSVNEDDGQGVTAAATPVLAEVEGNDSFATAQLIDRADLRIADNVDLGSDRLASISVTGEITDQGDTDNYQIQVAAGEIVTIDIDYAALYGTGQTPGYADGFGLDSLVRIYDANGTLIGSNDDASTAAGGEGSLVVTDSYLQFTAPADGIYYIQVGDFDGYYDQYGIYSQGPYTMQVSVDDPNGELTDSGSISFGDVDLSDGHGVTITSDTAGALGTLTASVSDASTGDGSGQIDWVYTVNKAELQFLATGETRTETFTVTVSDGNGGMVQQEVVITLVGENDAPVIETTGTQGGVTEDTSLTDGGVLAFSDVDLTDNHVVTTQQVGGVGGGVFSVTMTDDSTGDGTGEIAWSFEIQPGEFDWLSEGQTRLQRHVVTLDDGNGGVTEQLINVIITGTNDAVEITSAVDSGSVTEDALVYEGVVASETPVIAEGVQGEVQIIDRADLRIAPNGDLGNDGLPSITVVGEVTDPGEHDSYSIALTAGEIVTIDVDFAAGYGDQTPGYPAGFGLDALVYVYDSAGTLLNSNDDAALASGGAGSIYTQDSYLQFTAPADGAYTIVVTNYDGSTSYGQYTLQLSVDSSSNGDLTDSGTITFDDVDLSDAHAVSVAANGNDYLGELTAIVSDASTGDGSGEVTWTFAVGNPAVQYLGEGETLTQSYTITIDDGQGGQATQDVEITITGSNDAPVINTSFALGDTVEDQISEASGILEFSDIDLSDGHIVSFTPVGEGYYGAFEASVSDASTGDGEGQIAWSFAVDPADVQFLSEGQRLLQRYIVTLDDGNGGVTQQLVNVRIFGTNDAVEITSAVDSADVVDAPDGPPAVSDASGTIEFGDVDNFDGHFVEFFSNEGDQMGQFNAYLTDDSFGDGAGQVAWDFYMDPNQLDALGEGEIFTQTYTVAIDDGRGGRAEQVITINIVGTNDAPIAYALDAGVFNQNQAYMGLNAMSAVSDVDTNDSLTLDSISAVETSNPDRTFDYFIDNNDIIIDTGHFADLGEGESETVTFTYLVSDEFGGEVENTVTFVIEGRNDAPFAFAISEQVSEDDAGFGFNLITGGYAYDTDQGGWLDASNSAGFTITDAQIASSNGDRTVEYTLDGATGEFSLDPNQFTDLAEGESETVTLTFTLVDNSGASVPNTLTLTVNGANDAPVAIVDVSNANADLEQAGNVLDNDSDVDTSDVLSVISVRNEGGDEASANNSLVGALGTLLLNSDGSWTYVADQTNPAVFSLALGDTATDSFTYTVADGNGGVVEQTLEIHIIGVNTTPDAVADVASAMEDGAVITGNVGDNDSDPDAGAVLSYGLVHNAPDGFQLNSDGSWSFDPSNAAYQSLAEGEQLELVIDYVVTDEKGASAPSTLTVTITGANDGPIAVADTATTDENASVSIGVLANDSDVDTNAALSVTSAAINTGGGSVAIVDDQLVFDPGADFDSLSVGETAMVLIDYTIEDEHGVAASAQVTVTVTGSNDAPTVSAINLTGSTQLISLVGLVGADGLGVFQLEDGDGERNVDAVLSGTIQGEVDSEPSVGMDSGDIDGDGDIDIVIATGSGVEVYTNVGDIDGDGAADYEGTLLAGASAYDVELVDLNGDGLLDAVTHGGPSSNGMVQTYINLGDTNGNGLSDEFSLSEYAAGGPGSLQISSGDMNGDGLMDIVTVGFNSAVSIMLNQGDADGDGEIDYVRQAAGGGFSGVRGVDVGDIDGDGDLDYVVTRINGNSTIMLNQGDADGDGLIEFAPAVIGAPGGIRTILADINGDGDDETITVDPSYGLVIAHYGLNTDGNLYLNSTTTRLGENFRGISVADYDGDGDMDIYVSSTDADGSFLLINDGGVLGNWSVNYVNAPGASDATFLGVSVEGTGAREGGAPVTAAFVGDDIDSEDNQSTLTYEILSQPGEGEVVNNGDGTFTFDPGGDFQDLAFGESRTVSFTYRAIDAQGAASTVETVTIEVAGENDAPVITSGNAVSVDENATGVVYVAGATDVDGDAIGYSLSGDDAALFSIDSSSGEVSFLAAPDFEAPADADGDNAYDIVVSAHDGTASSDQAVAITVTDVDENQAPVAADVAFSGTTGRIVGLVLGGANVPGAVVSEFLDTDGNGYIDTVTQSTALGNPGYNYGIVSGDLDGDGDADFVISGGSAVYSYTNVGDTDGDGQDDYVVSQLTPYRVSTKLALVDLNGDGLLDLVGLRSGNLTQLINSGDANGNGLLDDFDFQSTAVVNQSNADGLAMADLNGDGLVDLVTGSGQGGYPTVISYNLGDTDNDGVIEFAQVQINDAYSGRVTSIDTGDIDGDGDIDFVVSRSVGAAQVVYLNQGDTDGDGNPDFLTMELQSGASNTVNELADIDGDGDLDVLSADQSGNFRIALNQGDTDGDGIVDFTYLDIATGGHSVYGMAIGDMDGDGDLDVVLSSRNANNRGRILFNEGDADGDGSPDFHVEAVDGFGYSFDVEFLYAGGSAGTQQVQEDGQVLTGQFDASDAEGDALTYVITSAPSEGSVTNNGDGTFDFDPGSDFQDLDEGETRDVSFQYHVVDAVGGVSNTATVTVTVRGTYDAPVVNEAPLVTYTSPPGEGPERMLGEGDPPADTIVQHWNGQIGYSDEASDSQTISFEPLGPAPFGTFEAHLVDDANGDGAGQIEWSFTVDNADLPAEDGSLFYTVFIEDSQGAVTEQVVEIAYYRILDASGESDDLAAALSTKGVVQTLIPENVDSGADKSDGLPAPVMDGVDGDSIPLASVDGLGLVNNLGTVSIEMGPDGFLTLDDADFTDLNQAMAGDGAAITTLIATGEFGLGHDVGLPAADTGGFVTLTVEADGFVSDIRQIFLPEAFMGSDGMLVLADNDTGIDLPTVLDTAEGW